MNEDPRKVFFLENCGYSDYINHITSSGIVHKEDLVKLEKILISEAGIQANPKLGSLGNIPGDICCAICDWLREVAYRPPQEILYYLRSLE